MARRSLTYAYFSFFAVELFIADALRGRNPGVQIPWIWSPRNEPIPRRGGLDRWLAFRGGDRRRKFSASSESAGLYWTELVTCGGKHGCNEFVLNTTK